MSYKQNTEDFIFPQNKIKIYKKWISDQEIEEQNKKESFIFCVTFLLATHDVFHVPIL